MFVRDKDDRLWYGALLALMLALQTLIGSYARAHFSRMMYKAMMRSHYVIVNSVFGKALRLSNKIQQEKSSMMTCQYEITYSGRDG